MIKVNKLTDYAVSILNHFASQEGAVFNATQLALALNLPLPTVSKILKILLKNKLLLSRRGAQGGYELAKPLHDINVAEVIEAMEGRLAVTECSATQGLCTHEQSCQMRSPWQKINQQVLALLTQISLADMTQTRILEQPSKGLL